MKALYTILLLLTVATSAEAQHNLGISTSNWTSLNSLYLNPANIADTREERVVNLLSFSGGVDNNVGPLNVAEGLVVAVGNGKANNMFNYSNNSKVSMLAPYVNITGPGVMQRIDSVSSFAITTRLRGMNQFSNFDQTLFHSFNDPNFRPSEDILATPTNFVYTVHLWAEIGFSYARVLFDNGQHKLKAGASVRYLWGIAYVGVNGRSMDVDFKKGDNLFFAGNTDIEYSSNVLNTEVSQGQNISQRFSELMMKGNFGRGVGGDMGLVYEYRSLDSKPKDGYKARFSVALCDLGMVGYSAKANTNEIFSGSGNVTGVGILDNVKNFESIKKYVENRGFTAEIRQKSARVYMPTRVMLGGDYHIQDDYYCNVTLLMNTASRSRLGNSYYNQLTVTPRYETKDVSMGLPLTYSTLSSRFKVGLGILTRGFFIGSDDLLSAFVKSEYGINLYAGLNVPIYR